MKKRFVCTMLSLVMCFTFIPCALAADEASNSDDCEMGIELYNNYQVIKNEDITSDGVSWVQPFGYGSYKIWVSNTTDEEMVVTHTAGIERKTYRVPAGEQCVVRISNHALPNVSHTLDFSIPSGAASGAVLGTVAVRVSTVKQYDD